MSDRDRIAVTGVGAISALGADARESFARLLRGERGLGEITLFSTDGLRCRIAAQIPDSNLGAANSAQPPSRTDVLALSAARAALVDARLVPEPGSLGLVFGGTAGAMFETEQEIARFGPEERSGRRGARLVSHPLSRTVSTLEKELGHFSRAATLCSACSSGAAAIVQAAHWIRSGNSKAVLAGGADGLCRMTFAGFNALGALDPEPCRPFDRARKGLNLGEGAAFLLLESEASALERGARILGFLSGWAIGAEAHHGTHPEPSGRRAAELMRSALECAGLEVADIDYVNAHGTATLHNDRMEAAALRLALGRDTARIAVSSTKGHFGHTLGAAGALEAVVTLLALDAGIAPATAGLGSAEDEGLNHVMGDPRPGALRAAISNSFGFGGMDAVLVFESANATRRTLSPRGAALVVTGSACSASGVEEDPRDALDPERSRRFDRLTARVTLGASAALIDAKLEAQEVGLVVGNAYGNVERSMRFLDRLLFQGLRHAPPAEFPHLLHSAAAGHASIYLGLAGPVFSVAEGSLGAEGALFGAQALLDLGVAPAVLAGAIEVRDPFVAEIEPRHAGLSRGEGGGFLVVERETAARERGVQPLCEIVLLAEERGAIRSASLVPPVRVGRARVIGCGEPTALSVRIDGTSWSGVERESVPSGTDSSHEASGALALVRAVTLIRSGQADETLVLSGDATRRAFAHFRRWEGRVAERKR